MGRSAKVFKKPTKSQKTASKIAKAASKPLPPPSPPEPTAEKQNDGGPKVKKRKMMRAKVDKKLGQA